MSRGQVNYQSDTQKPTAPCVVRSACSIKEKATLKGRAAAPGGVQASTKSVASGLEYNTTAHSVQRSLPVI